MSDEHRDKAQANLDALRSKGGSEAVRGMMKSLETTLKGVQRKSTEDTSHGKQVDAAADKPTHKPRANRRRQAGDLLNEHDVAARLSKSVQTIRRWRMFKEGPKFFKVGASVRYKAEDVATWLDAQPTGGAQPKKGK
jgi:predicted DNA-binding transcriptional regulator AlpA